jgi:ATP-dependent Lon protease
MDQVLEHALTRRPEPIEWDERSVPAPKAPASDDDAPGFVAH